MNIQKYEFKSNALAYINHELNNSGPYGHSILKNIPLEEGIIEVYVPPNLFEYVNDFTDSIIFCHIQLGGDSKEIHLEFDSILENLITHYLYDSDGCAVFETFDHPDSHILNRRINSYLIFEDRVLLYLSQKNLVDETVLSYWDHARNYPKVVGLSTFSQHCQNIKPKQEIDSETLVLLATTTEYLLIGAYDDEGYIVWRRKTSPDALSIPKKHRLNNIVKDP